MTPESQQTFKGTHGCATCPASYQEEGSFVLSTHLHGIPQPPSTAETRVPMQQSNCKKRDRRENPQQGIEIVCTSLLEIVFCESDEPGF